jgi:GT2 family glycosyltransferase
MLDLVISIVVYNSDINKLKQIVEKVNLEKKLHIKLVIIDNLSKQNYFNKLVSLDCTVISAGKNFGYGKSNNIVFDITPKSKYFLIMNPDIILENDSLIKLFNFMEQEKNISLCSPILKNNEYFYEINRKNFNFLNMFRRFVTQKKDFLTESQVNDLFKTSNFTNVSRISGSFMFIRSEIFKKIGGFNEIFFMYFEDIELCDKVSEVGKIVMTNITSVFHERQRHSYKKPKFFFIHLISFLKYKILNIKK